MQARTLGQQVVAWCDRCHAMSSYQYGEGGSQYGSHGWHDAGPHFELYRLYRCSGCNRGAVAEFHNMVQNTDDAVLIAFDPASIRTEPLPADSPADVVAEFREAEQCATARAYRGGTALLRSALEKTLKANGYTSGNLKQKIDAAAADGVITAARKQRAHDDVRVLGNEVVHDEWRVVSEDEFVAAHLYTQRIVEDFYKHRAEVVSVLRAAGRIT